MADRKRDGSLPSKVCPACGRPFQWRRRWARCWDEVVWCSDACRRAPKPKADPKPKVDPKPRVDR